MSVWGGGDRGQEGKRGPGRDLCVTGHVSVPESSWGGRFALRGGCTLLFPSCVWGWIHVLPLKHPGLAKRIRRPRRRGLFENTWVAMLRSMEPGLAGEQRLVTAVFLICMLWLCLQSSSLLSIRLLEVGKVLNHLYSWLYGRFSCSLSPANAQKWVAETEGNSAACAWLCLRWESCGPGRGTVWLEHRVVSSSVALVAPWRTGHREDACLHLAEASGHSTVGGYGGVEGGFL